MTINRKELVRRHNPVLNQMTVESPLTVGNGDFGFTVDVTGLQTLYPAYENCLPLCTMSSWGWHTIPACAEQKQYTLSDLVMTEYDYCGRTVAYPVQKQPGNEVVYHWLRKNPHRMSLAAVAIYYQGSKVVAEQLSKLHQELDLYEGIINSSYAISGHLLNARTAAHFDRCSLAYSLTGNPDVLNEVSFVCSFPYGSYQISGADWQPGKANRTEIVMAEEQFVLLKRSVDDDTYWVAVQVQGEPGQTVDAVLNENELELSLRAEFSAPCACSSAQISITVSFYQNETDAKAMVSADEIFTSSQQGWQQFWEQGGIIKLAPYAEELQNIWQELADAILRYQHQDTGMWYQVPNIPQMPLNYLEASGSAIFAYAIMKSVRTGLLESAYFTAGEKAFHGICQQYLTEKDGAFNLGGICLVAGLGNTAHREGTFDYYMQEPVVENDAKGVAPLLLAYTELLQKEKNVK